MDTCPHCGCELPKAGKARSSKAHNMLFGVISEAWQQWPEQHTFQPESPEHLRAYLFTKARHFDPVDVKVKHGNQHLLAAQLPAVVKAYSGGKAPLLHAYPWGVRLFVPRSIAGKPESRDFHRVSSKCYEVIEAAVGVSVERLQRGMRLAA